MSRIAKLPLPLPKNVECTQSDNSLKVKGPKGELAMHLNPEIKVEINDGVATVEARSGSRFAQAMTGTTMALTSGCTERPPSTAAASRRSSILPLVQEPMKAASMQISLAFWPADSAW